jgi:hypothetical protein
MLKALQIDYDFIEISENQENHDDKLIIKELESRFNPFPKIRSNENNTFFLPLLIYDRSFYRLSKS